MEGILWLLVIAVFFYFMMRFGCGAHMVHGHGGTATSHGGGMGHAAHEQPAARSSDTPNRLDLVCGMQAESASYRRMYEGVEYWFCSQKCQDQFDAEPARYVI